MRLFAVIVGLILLAAIPQQANAGTLGCLLGAAGGGYGGAQIGKGSGQLAAVAAGTLLGCGVGSNIQNSDQRHSQQPSYQNYRYRPYYGQRNGYINYDYDQRRVPYVTPSYSSYRYRQEPRVVYVPLRRRVIVVQTPARVVYVQPQQRVVQSNRYCREYQAPMITIGGKPAEGYGQACSYDGGKTWELGDLQEVQ